MNNNLNSRLCRLESKTEDGDIVVVHNALSGPDDPELMPRVGETFDQYYTRIVADGIAKKLPFILVMAWYSAENRPYDGDWFGDLSV